MPYPLPENAAEFLRAALARGLAAVGPTRVISPHLPPPPRGRLYVVGAGKAAAATAAAVEAHYESGSGVDIAGLVVTRYGHGAPTERVRVVEASHPVPDAAGRRAAREVLGLAEGLGEDDLLLCLLSGGGSALLSAPQGVTLEEKAALTEALLRSGADITEMNAVRKHLSSIKGGGLARAAAPARVVSLILSDVAGDDLSTVLSTVASGPTAPDPTTFEDALAVLDRYKIQAPAARKRLERGARGELAETPKPNDPLFARVENRLLAGAQEMLEAVAASFRERDVTPFILSGSLTGESREAAKFHAALARQVRLHAQPCAPPCALLSGGETTVTVRGGGRGGRNCEFALALALELRGLSGVYALAADTDGVDGSEDAAGAIITPETLSEVGRAEARRALEANDSYTLLKRCGALVFTGPTLTNVNDLRIVLVT